jgi:nucleotide-binding universal stress UspA family protein
VSDFSRVLVAVDGSDNAARALDVAVGLCRATGAQLVVGHAVGLLEEQSMHEVRVDERFVEIQQQVEEWCASARAAGLVPQVEVVPGSPVPALLATAERVRADVVVVGSRGVGGFGGRQLGSTSQGLVTESHVPVLVVPAP